MLPGATPCQVQPSIVISASDWSPGYLAASYLRSHWLMSLDTALPTQQATRTLNSKLTNITCVSLPLAFEVALLSLKFN